MITLCGGDTGSSFSAWIIPFLLLGVWFTYLYFARQVVVTGHRWSLKRTLYWTTGIGLLMLALWPPLASRMHYDIRGHMVQHLLIGMAAPLGLVLAAPVTLVLRTLPTRVARRVMRGLRSPGGRGVTHPITAAVLNMGGMYLLYLTPLYAYTLTHPYLHPLIHVHFLMAGCLFAWAIIRPDPMAHCPSFRLRLGVLFVSLAAHACLSKLMYAQGWPRQTLHPLAQIREAAQWMYYGGDGLEILLIIALFAGWYQARGRRLGRGAVPLLS